MTDSVVVILDENSLAVADSVAANVLISPQESSTAVVEVELQNQVVVRTDPAVVVVESSAKGEKGDKGDPGDAADVGPIIDDAVAGLNGTINSAVLGLQAEIATARTELQTEWNTALNAAQSEIDSELSTGLTALQNALDDLELNTSIDISGVVTQINTAVTAAKNEMAAADLVLDGKFTGISNTLTTELAAANLALEDIVLDVDQFSLDLSASNTLLNNTILDYSQFKTLTAGDIDEVKNAVFMIDPDTGLVVLKAYHYTDEKFSQASIAINGVSGQIDLTNNNLAVETGRITSANNRISLLETGIELKVSYAEMNESIAGAISAVAPAYSFGFFNSTEGWSAVAGTITNTGNKVSVTRGDITNQALSYSADDNPVITLTITRTGGTGWVGDMYVTYSGGSTVQYPGVLLDVPTGAPFVRTLNLSEETSYAGTAVGIRFVLGASNADTFDLDDITIGKPSAALTQLEGIQGQINDLGIELDGVAGQLTNYVTTTTFNANAVTLSNVSTVLDGVNSIISLKATQTLLNSNGTVSKANSASSWVDAANANITSVITTFNAQPGGINAQLGTITGNYNTVSSKLDAITNTISDQLVSIYGLKVGIDDVNKAGIYAQLKLKQVQDNALAIGDSVAVAQRQINAISSEQSALSQQIVQLNASYGGYIGQLNSEVINTQKALSDATSATALELTRLNANLSATIDANYQTLNQSIVDANTASVNSYTALESKFTSDISALNQSLSSTIATLSFAKTEDVDLIRAEMYDRYASKEDLSSAMVTANEVTALAASELEGKITNQEVVLSAKIQDVRELTLTEFAAKAQDIESLRVEMGASSSALAYEISAVKATAQESLASNISGVEAKFEANMASKAQLTEAMASERQATLDDISNLSATVGTVYSTKTETTQLIADESAARATAISNLSANTASTYATISALNTAIATERASSVSDINTLSAAVGTTYATKTALTDAISTESAARIQAINTLSATVSNNYALTADVTSAIATETAARVQALNTLSANTASTYATISSLNTVAADANSAMITYVDNKQAFYDGRYASISRVDIIEANVNGNKASSEIALFSTNKKVTDAAKRVIQTLIDMEKQRNNLLELGDAAALGQRQIAIEVGAAALAQEKADLVASIGRVTGQTNSVYTAVTKAVADEAGNRASALTKLSTDLNGAIAVVQTQLNSVSTSVTGVNTSVSGIQATLNDSNTGLAATYTVAQSAKTDAANGATAIAELSAAVNNPVTGLSATFSNVQKAFVDMNGMSQSISQLSTGVATANGNSTEALLQLSSVSNALGELSSRATLGVVGTTNGVTTINGVTIDGATNSIMFQANTFGLVNTSGAQQLYYNTVSNKWEFAGDLIAGTYATSVSGFRVELSNDGDLVIFVGSGDKTKENAVFYVDKAGTVKAKNMQLDTPVVTTGVLKNARLDFVGSEYIRVEAAEAFGPHNLISWFGKIVPGVNYNTVTKEPIYSALLKSNAKTYISASGDVYFGGTFQAGTLSASGTSTLMATNVTREIEFTSNGGPIVIAVSYSTGGFAIGPTDGNASSVLCPVERLWPAPSGIVYLENWNGTAWVILAQWSYLGTSTCNDGSYEPEVGVDNIPYDEIAAGGLNQTYTDQSGISGIRKMRVRLAAAAILSGYGGTQSLSIATTE